MEKSQATINNLYDWSGNSSQEQSNSYPSSTICDFSQPPPPLPNPPLPLPPLPSPQNPPASSQVPCNTYAPYDYTNQSHYYQTNLPYPIDHSTFYYQGQTAGQNYYGTNYFQYQANSYTYGYVQNWQQHDVTKTDSSTGATSLSISQTNKTDNIDSQMAKFEALINRKKRLRSPESGYSSNYHDRRSKESKYRGDSKDCGYKRRSRSPDRRSNSSYFSGKKDSSSNRYSMSSRASTINKSSLPNRSSRRSRSRSSNRLKNRSRSRSKRRSRSQESRPSELASRINSSKRNPPSEREMILEKYRRNYCATSEDIRQKMDELEIEGEKRTWIRSAPAELYYTRNPNNPNVLQGTEKLKIVTEHFHTMLLKRAEAARALQPKYEPPPRKTKVRLCKHKSEACSSSSDSDIDSMDECDNTMEELQAKKLHPQRLHPEMWFNDAGEMNDGPLCRCSAKSRRSGIRHGIYVGEDLLYNCDTETNNADKLYHYRITISPPTNFLTKTPTIIEHDEHEFIFEGFSMFSHSRLEKLPTCKVIRFNIEYTILYIEEKMPEHFAIKELDYFHQYLFKEILELVDFDLHPAQSNNGCGQFHFMPRFVRDLPDNGQEILSMNEVLSYLIKSSNLLIEAEELPKLIEESQYTWQNFADEVKGMVVTYPGKKPCSVRVDQLDRTQGDQPPGVIIFPEIVHFGIRPPQLSYAGNTDYQKAWRDYVKFRHLLANMPKPTFEDKRKLEAKENKLQELRTQNKMKRDVTVDISSEGFYRTGIMCDIVQHAMLIPVLVCHLRFHKSLDYLEKTLKYEFKNRYLLQLALTHPSYRENFGTNPDHARNSLTNCGIRQPEYGDRRIHYMNTRKRGINTLINIMSRFGSRKETESSIAHNERLEFLGDAVVEFLTSIHLFHMFPDLEEGGLATYRAAIVQNQHLAVLAKKLCLEQFMLYAHGSDLCHDLELRHAMANCFEALMGALFLDGGIEVADRVFAETLFKDEDELLNTWINYPRHPLQEQEPLGDRQWINNYEILQKLTKFEEIIGIEFNHIRLLARAFTDRSIGYTNLTLGSNQRLEFLGDTVLQLIVSDYLYKHFPEHHEGHLSLLRSSLVNNKTQAVVCDDLGMTQYAVYGNPKAELKTKDRADLLEAFLGSLYVDKGLRFCEVFCNICFFPRLQDFIMNQDWNDPKSKLQQCCLTLRTMDGGEPDIPVYKVIECKGPTNTRVYTVAVYFQGKRLAKASGHSIQEAEMNSAKEALIKSQGLFPQLDHQKRVIAKSMKMQNWAQSNYKPDFSRSSYSRDRRSESLDKDRVYRRERRSRSREREKRRSHSRDRYDSSDRRILRDSSSDSNASGRKSLSPKRIINYSSSSSSDEDNTSTEKNKRKRRRSSASSNLSSDKEIKENKLPSAKKVAKNQELVDEEPSCVLSI